MTNNIARFNPFAELRALERQFFGDDFTSVRSGFDAPATDVYTKDGAYVIEAHLPGVKKEDLNVDVDEGRLSISAELTQKEESDDRKYLVRESSASFRRSVRLPDGADISKITADLNDGVLKVTVPAPAAVEKKRTIEVTSGNTDGEETKAVEEEK